MRAYCYGSGNTCYGGNIEGQAYGLRAQSDNSSGTSIGIYGTSNGIVGQGVAGFSDKNYSYGGVFTATGYSGVGVKASSVSIYGVLGLSEQQVAVYGLSGVNGVGPGPGFSVFGDTFLGTTTTGVAGNGDQGDGVYGVSAGGTNGASGAITDVTAGVAGNNHMYNGGPALLNAGVFGTCHICTG